MLTVEKVTGQVAAGYADYLQAKTTSAELGDYYLKDGERVEAAGRWITGGRHLGIYGSDRVSGEVLRELMAVRHPATGQPLRPAGGTGEIVAALDATFSAPKSVSATWALANPDLRTQIEAAHEQAIDTAIRYSVERVPMVRERLSKRVVIHTKVKDVIATGWRHTTARSVNGRPPDPQLHTHVLLHAAIRKDGRTVAIDSRSWLLHRRELGAAYRTHLAQELAHLGFQIQRGTGRGGRYFEIAGIPQGLLDRWSSRHQQIREAIAQRLEQTGRRLSPREERLIAVTTRAGKRPVTTRDLDSAWITAANESGFSRAAFARVRNNVPVELPPASPGALLAGLTEFDATFTDRQARAVALEQTAGTPIPDAISALRHARAEGVLLQLADGKWTTNEHRQAERQVLATFRSLLENPVEAIPDELVAEARTIVDRQLADRGGQLSTEQLEALRLACSDRQVVMIEGQAGTGKSTVLQAVALAHHANGHRLIVTSTAALAAQRLGNDITETGVAVDAYSTVALKHAVDGRQVEVGPDVTVIHDEAALASTREQRDLFSEIDASGARLIIVGDPAQSLPVGAGGLWTELQHTAEAAEARVELTINLRALDPADRRDQKLFRDGHTLEAVDGYLSRSRIHLADAQADAEHQALLAAHHDRQSGRSTLVIAQTSNEHLDELNAHAQALRSADGELGADSVPVPGRPYELHAGDHIQIRSTIQHPDGPLRNGTSATVHNVERNGGISIQLDDGSIRDLSHRQLEGADLRLGYVQHPVPTQGATVDSAHLIVAGHATRQGTYVAITRARERTDIHAATEALEAGQQQDPTESPLERLADALSRDEPEIASIRTPLRYHANEREHVESVIDIGHGWGP